MMTSVSGFWPDGIIVLLAFGTMGWLVSLLKRDVSIVDSMWPLMFLLVSLVYSEQGEAGGPRRTLILILVTIWSLRLAIYITARNWGAEEDSRYQAIRRNNEPYFFLKSIYIVFGLQAVLAWIISLPLAAATGSQGPLTMLDMLGASLWIVGFLFESIADLQLARFKRDPGNSGKVLETGLWKYSRHPNYFGEFCIWWGFYLIALSTGAWWSIVSPLLMTFLLLKISGVALLEKDISNRRPGYDRYVRNTNAFFPGPTGMSNQN